MFNVFSIMTPLKIFHKLVLNNLNNTYEKIIQITK